jgi:putative restriction endonuclease
MRNNLERDGVKWSEDEIVLALAFYCNQPPVNRDGHGRSEPLNLLAAALGRKPGSVGLKLANIFACDPSMAELGKKGLERGSMLDAKIWNRFQDKWDLLPEAVLDSILRIIPQEKQEAVFDILLPSETPEVSLVRSPSTGDALSVITNRKAVSKLFFKQTVLNVFGNKCCLTGIDEKRLLVAARIRPVSNDSSAELAQPTNGLCLDVLHGRAFEQGLATVRASDFTFHASPRLRRNDPWFVQYFEPYEGKPIELPKGFRPSVDFLKYHNRNVFVA